ncbi:hypothetical protein WN943_013893 [Citrus x changshan-huyou]
MLDDTLVSALLLDGSSWNLPLLHQHLAMDVFYIIKRKLPPQRVAATESCRILINTRSTWSNQLLMFKLGKVGFAAVVHNQDDVVMVSTIDFRVSSNDFRVG